MAQQKGVAVRQLVALAQVQLGDLFGDMLQVELLPLPVAEQRGLFARPRGDIFIVQSSHGGLPRIRPSCTSKVPWKM
ncbi:hypothetical protein ASC94_28915 [Massilia sp. Root418]|nr:hypothetical protein ASC94_28915 [Massilia sp. Root418]